MGGIRLQIALGSLNELQTQLELGVRLGFIDRDVMQEALDLCTEIEKMFVALILKLRAEIKGNH